MKKSQACRPSGRARAGSRSGRGRRRRRGRGTRRGGDRGGGGRSRRRRAAACRRGRSGPAAGPASRNEARMRSAHPRSTSVWSSSSAQQRDHVLVAPLRLHAEPHEQLDHRLHVADARDVAQHDLLAREQDAASAGSAAFLLPAGTTVPDRGVAALDDELLHAGIRPGGRGNERLRKGIEGHLAARFGSWAGYPAAHAPTDSRRGLAARLRVDRVRLAAQAPARRRGRDARLRPRVGRGRGAVGASPASCTTSTTSATRTSTPATRARRSSCSRSGATRRS